LSATGAPVAFVNLFSADMVDSSVVFGRLRQLQARRSAGGRNNFNALIFDRTGVGFTRAKRNLG
jgi:hypothetical protein